MSNRQISNSLLPAIAVGVWLLIPSYYLRAAEEDNKTPEFAVFFAK